MATPMRISGAMSKSLLIVEQATAAAILRR